MSVHYIIQHGAPTLAGLKTGNLFPCAIEDRDAFFRTLREANQVLLPRGLRLLPLRLESSRALLYLFRPDCLSRDLSREEAQAILRRAGYTDADYRRCLRELTRRLRSGEPFPHEIGLFLGYPPEDVQGFMEHHGRGSKCSGCWKVYGDAEAAQKRFEAYRACTERYSRLSRMGATLEHLTVFS